MRNPLWRGALSLSGQLKIAGAGATTVYAVGGAPGSQKDARLPAASWLSRWTCSWEAHHSTQARGSKESEPKLEMKGP